MLLFFVKTWHFEVFGSYCNLESKHKVKIDVEQEEGVSIQYTFKAWELVPGPSGKNDCLRMI